MDPASCRVIYIDDRFAEEKWLTREMVPSPTTQNRTNQKRSPDLAELPLDLQANVNAILGVFNQVLMCKSGTSFSAKLAEIQESVKLDCTPILALFDVDSSLKHDHNPKTSAHRSHRLSPTAPPVLRRQLTFSAEADESYGLQLLSRIASDLQVDEGAKLVIPVALVRMRRKDSNAAPTPPVRNSYPQKISPVASAFDDRPSPIDPQMMLQCLDAGALDVVPCPLNNEKIMGLTVHAYRIYKTAKKQQSAFLASASNFIATARRRKQSWVGIEDEKPYAYLREAMVKKLLKGICEPETIIEDYQHRELNVEEERKQDVIEEVGKWSFCAHDFSEDELVYAGFYMLNHALQMPELAKWRMDQDEILRFMQASRVAYNSFVLYHNFRHAVDVLQSLFYFLVQIGTIPPYPLGSAPPPSSNDKSAMAQLLTAFEALTLLIAAIGHDVGHPGVNNMFLVKLNAPLAQLYNDQSVLEAFHCAAYSQILRRHWPSIFADKSLRKLLISSILATDMGVHPEYMQRLGNLQEKIHESQTTDGWAPKDVDMYRILTCGLLIKCADISNVARPWMVAEQWTHLLQLEFASQGDMESQVGMETTLFGGPPEIGNVMKLANGQVGFMTIFAHPLFANVTDIIPAMGFAAAEILNNKGVWTTRIEQEKRKKLLMNEASANDGAISPRSQSPAARKLESRHTTHSPSAGYFPTSPLRHASNPPSPVQPEVKTSADSSLASRSSGRATDNTPTQQSEAPAWRSHLLENGEEDTTYMTAALEETHPTTSGVFPGLLPLLESGRPEPQTRKSSNALPHSLQMNGVSGFQGESTTTTTASSVHEGEDGRRPSELRKSNYTVPLLYDDSTPLPNQHRGREEESRNWDGPSRPDSGLPASKYHSISGRPYSQTQNQARNSGRMSVPSSTDRNSLATSGGVTYSTNLPSTLSPSTEATSFLSVESGDEHWEDHRNGQFRPIKTRNSDRNRASSGPSTLPEVVPPQMMDHIPHAGSSISGVGRRTKSPMKSSTAVLKEPGQEMVSSWDEGDGDRSMRRRISRLRFWKRRSDDDDR